MPCDGPIDAQLVYSRDGVTWLHADRERSAVIPRGADGAFDSGMIIGTAKEPIVEGDHVHWYYTGGEHTHGEANMEKRVKRIGRVSWKKERFVAVEAAGAGTLLTKELSFPEKASGFRVNVDAQGGRVEAEICYPDGRTVPGYGRKDAAPCSSDTLDWRPMWSGADTSSLPGTVKVRLHLSSARVYSIAATTHDNTQ
jgi:hypothetical protein